MATEQIIISFHVRRYHHNRWGIIKKTYDENGKLVDTIVILDVYSTKAEAVNAVLDLFSEYQIAYA